MLRFGVPRLDDALAEHDQHQPTLIQNEPGVDAQPFLLQAAAEATQRGEKVVYCSTDRSPARIVAGIERLEGDVRHLEVLDAHASITGFAEPDFEVIDARELDTFLDRLSKAEANLFILDSLNGLAVAAHAGRVVEQRNRILQSLAHFDDALVSHTAWGPTEELQPLLDGFQNQIALEGVEERIITNQYFKVKRINGEAGSDAPVLFTSERGPVRVYIPKILITGDADAGKTTFVHAVCDRAVSAERGGKTVALDRGHVEREGMRVEVFGMPGQPRFDPLLAPLMAHAMGVVLMVDSSRPETFPRAMDLLRRSWKRGLHAVIAANKQDLEEANQVQTVREQLKPPAGVDILECQASDPASARKVLDHLIYSILSREPRT